MLIRRLSRPRAVLRLGLSLTLLLLALPTSFARARDRSPNGCGTTSTYWVPELHFTPACNRHDLCYASGGASRKTCDLRFLADMRAICDSRPHRYSCRLLADVYYGAVRLLGGWAFASARGG